MEERGKGGGEGESDVKHVHVPSVSNRKLVIVRRTPGEGSLGGN